MCLTNRAPDEEKDAREYWCWSCSEKVKEADYRIHDVRNCDIEEEKEWPK